jgi:Staphylococcal nuclease homologue
MLSTSPIRSSLSHRAASGGLGRIERGKGDRRTSLNPNLVSCVVAHTPGSGRPPPAGWRGRGIGLWQAATEPAPEAGLFKVVRVVDGDTIYVAYGGHSERIRFIGMNTPELHHPPTKGEEPGGREAAEANSRLVAGKWVQLEPDVQLRDHYGRMLAYVWLPQRDGARVMVNAEPLEPACPSAPGVAGVRVRHHMSG